MSIKLYNKLHFTKKLLLTFEKNLTLSPYIIKLRFSRLYLTI